MKHSSFLIVTPHDPLIARDGRPFNFGIRMKSLDWPHPSVMAGSLRTLLGKETDIDFDSDTVKALKKIEIAGALPLYRSILYFPAPKDVLVKVNRKPVPEKNEPGEYAHFTLRPMELAGDEWCDLPDGSLKPALLPKEAGNEFKPEQFAQLWSIYTMTAWLTNPEGVRFVDSISPGEREKNPLGDVMRSDRVYVMVKRDISSSDEKKPLPPDSLDLPEKALRTHISIDSRTGKAEDKKLFETIGLDFAIQKAADQLQVAARVELPDTDETKEIAERLGSFREKVSKIDTLHPFGGERRLSHWKTSDEQAGWECPAEIKIALKEERKVRMVLATPAVFSGGWLPGWLAKKDGQIRGSPPGAPAGLEVRLVSACVDRWKPLSGWSLEKGRVGPKPIRRMVPAGSVYFFEIESGSATDLAEGCWLRPVSDDPQNRSDGFGLALWGSWGNEREGSTDEQTRRR